MSENPRGANVVDEGTRHYLSESGAVGAAVCLIATFTPMTKRIHARTALINEPKRTFKGPILAQCGADNELRHCHLNMYTLEKLLARYILAFSLRSWSAQLD